MNNDDYKFDVLALLGEIADNTRKEDDIIIGQRYHRALKQERRASWLHKLGQLRGSKIWISGLPCSCGEGHCLVILKRDEEVVVELCPYVVWLRLVALFIEEGRGKEVGKWPRSKFVRQNQG